MNSILVVDDSPIARKIAIKCLSNIGIGEKITEAENGKVALDLIRESTPDLILADLNMPVMDGLTMLRKIKASPRMCGIPVIVVSSILDAEKRRELEERGVDLLIPKPISPPELIAAIEGIRAAEELENQ